jgi:hypothetical protein
MYSSTLLTSALEGVYDQQHTPAALPQGKTQYPFWIWRCDCILILLEITKYYYIKI